jgi:tetratricopeptide (TPR) repeat protein
MKYLPIIGFTVALVSVADVAVAKTPAEIESIAKAVTVEIRLLKAESVGSGIIIDRKGDTYTLVTNRHVVCGKIRQCTAPPSVETYTVKLGDGQKYRVLAKSVQLLGDGLDLAIAQFQSDRTYQVAQVADPHRLKAGDAIYTSGYPATPPGFSFNTGKAIAVVDKRLNGDRGGYTVIYDAQTQPGMSGGGVFSLEGRLVAIHGQGEKYTDNTELQVVSSARIVRVKPETGSKIGLNRGIPVRWVIQGLVERGIGFRNLPRVNFGQVSVNIADEHFITGFNKYIDPGADVVAGKRSAISSFTQAIGLDPRYTYSYIMRAESYTQLQEDRLALADYDRAIALDPNKYPFAYNARGLLKQERLNDPNGALTDYNRAIALSPQYAIPYYNRGNLMREIGYIEAALADYDRAIALDPKYAAHYNNRGLLKAQANDPRGALADYNRAIALDDEFANAYGARGYLKYTKLGDKSGGIADTRQAAKLARAQKNSRVLQTALQTLQSWGVRE